MKNTLQKSLPTRNLGLAGRFTYGFSDRYFAEFNFGYNGSERFDKSHVGDSSRREVWAGLCPMKNSGRTNRFPSCQYA